MFKFNFNIENNKEFDEITSKDSKNEVKSICKESTEIKISSDQFEAIAETLKTAKLNIFSLETHDLNIGYVALSDDVIESSHHTDLIPAVYEGGFKIWECTYDLAEFLAKNSKEIVDKNVCDLGCSAGILGILSLVNEAKHVDFQDYNADVLMRFTIPNVIESCRERGRTEDFSKCCGFFSGDWDSFRLMTIDNEKYDTILTAETIYNPENYSKLLEFFKERLKKNGVVYLSAKSYYFGVAGNILDFCKLLTADNSFSYEMIWKSSDGVQREILLIKWIK